MSKKVVSLLLTLLLALSVCIPAFATAAEPADQADVSESAETEETFAEEEPAEEAPTGQPETTETEEETETSSDATPEDPATSEEDQDNSDEIATIASGNEIPVKIVGENSNDYDKRAFYFEDAMDYNDSDTLDYPIPDQISPGKTFSLLVHHGYTLESVKGCTVSLDDDFYSPERYLVKVDDNASEVQIKVVPTDMITLKLLGATDKLEMEDEFGEKVTDGLVVPNRTDVTVKSGLDSGYIVEGNIEIEYSAGGAGGVYYRHYEDDGDVVKTANYLLQATDQDNNGIVTFNVVKGVLVVLNDPDGGIYFPEYGGPLYCSIPSVLHVGDGIGYLLVKPGFSVAVAGGKIDDGYYYYDEETGDLLCRWYYVTAGAEETLVINIEKTDEPIPPYQPDEVKQVKIKYENKPAFIGETPDYYYRDGSIFNISVGKDYTVKAEGAKVYFGGYIEDIEHGYTTNDIDQAVGKRYKIRLNYENHETATEITLTAVKGSHDVKLVVEGDKNALIAGEGLNVDGDILKEGEGKIRLKNGYILVYSNHFYYDDIDLYNDYFHQRSRYDVFGGEIFREYDILVPTDMDTLTIEIVKTSPSRWIEVSVNNPEGISYSLDPASVMNDAGNYLIFYEDEYYTRYAELLYEYGEDALSDFLSKYGEDALSHSPLCAIILKRGYRPEVVGGTEEFAYWSPEDRWMDVYGIYVDEGVDKITITLNRGADHETVLPDGANSSANEQILYETVMHLLDKADPEDPEMAKLKELIENAVGKQVIAEVVMKEVPGPAGNVNADDFNGEFYYVDIHIDIKIDGKVVGTLGTTDEALKFSQEYKEELGRIVVVVREHNGESEYLPVEIDGDTLWFSSDMFSIFAIGYTNDINYAEVDDIPNQKYTGKPVEPEVVVTANGKPLTLGQDYTVAYENNIEEGVATAIITGINGFEGKKEVPFVIGNGELPSEPSKPSTTPTPTPKPDYGIIPDVPWYQYQSEDEGEYVPGPDEVTYSFPDVDPNAWYAGPVGWAAQSGVTAGYPDGNFHPDDTCTRAQIVTFLWKAAGTPMSVGTVSFSDVEQGSFYYDAAVWAANSGIIAGYPDGNFHPDDPCTRAQIVAMLYRYANSPAVSGESKFFDVDAGAYYYNAAIWAEQNGIVAGYPDGGFHPDDACTRAQIVTMLYNYIKG